MPNKDGYGAILVRDGFPWAEAYYWDGQGNVETIFQRPALPVEEMKTKFSQFAKQFFNIKSKPMK